MVEPDATANVVSAPTSNVAPTVETPVVPPVPETKPAETPKAQEKVVTDYEKAYKELQKKHQKEVEEKRLYQQRAEANDAVLQRLGTVEDWLAKLHDRLPGDMEDELLDADKPKPKVSLSEELKQRRAREQIEAQVKQSQQKIITEIVETLNEEGIPQDDERIKDIWTEPSPEAGRTKLGKVLAKIHKEEKTKAEQNIDKLVELRVKEALQKTGLLNMDMSGAGGGGKADPKTIVENYNRDPEKPEYKSAYYKLRRERGL